jgi:hypothetical protein
MSSVTVCLTNWRRPENLKRIINQIRNQSVPIKIFLWNNGPYINVADVDWYVESSVNVICAARWFMAASADTDFVCIHDDDLFLTDDEVFSDILKIAERLPSTTILGPTGVKLRPGVDYKDADHFYSFRSNLTTDTQCDIIKGSMMLMKTSELRSKVNLTIFNYQKEEDILVSALLAGGRLGQHLCLTSFGGRFESVGNDDFALWRNNGHMAAREMACKQFFTTPKNGLK